MECGGLTPLWRARHAAAGKRPRLAAEWRCEPMRGRNSRNRGLQDATLRFLLGRIPTSLSPRVGPRSGPTLGTRHPRHKTPSGFRHARAWGGHRRWVGRNPVGVDELLGVGFPRVARGAGYPGLRDGTSSRFSICLEGTSVGQREGLPPLSSVRAEPPARGRRKAVASHRTHTGIASDRAWFMGRRVFQNLDTHWDHEPPAQSLTRPTATLSRCGRARDLGRLRLMGWRATGAPVCKHHAG